MSVWLDLTGVAAGAISGALVAGNKRLDWIGVAVVAGITAIGGGTVRDVLLDRTPFWIANPLFIYAALLATVFTVIYARHRVFPQRILEGVDAVSLAVFGLTAARISESCGHGGIIAIVMGVITGVFGGLLRDVVCNEVPMVLRRGQLYATAVIAGCSVYLLLPHWGVPNPYALWAGGVTTFVVRIAAIVFNLRLPEFHLPPDTDNQ